MSVILKPQTEKRIRHWIDNGQYPDADTVIDKALQLLEEREQERFLKLREMVLAGHNSGMGDVLTPELWEEIARDADEADRRGLPIRNEVQL
jgi:putative addiction module CopG family antidote